MCVKGHNRARGNNSNEEADSMARRAGWIGAWISEPEVATRQVSVKPCPYT